MGEGRLCDAYLVELGIFWAHSFHTTSILLPGRTSPS